MVRSLLVLLIILSAQCAFAQNPATEQQIKDLSKAKWQWMADKNVDKLASLFDDKAKFVHMSGTWKKDEELEIIKTGSIWYKNTDVHDVAVEITDDVAVLWNRITLTAVVRGSDAVTQFTVTEVYKKHGNEWKLLALTFSSVRDTHIIKHLWDCNKSLYLSVMSTAYYDVRGFKGCSEYLIVINVSDERTYY